LEGFGGRAGKGKIDAAGGDVTAAVRKWLVVNDRIERSRAPPSLRPAP
jgi:hypothetical protein